MDPKFSIVDGPQAELANLAHRDGIAFAKNSDSGEVFVALHESQLDNVPGLPTDIRDTARFTQTECECVVYVFVLKPIR